jgi:hypothetical protein
MASVTCIGESHMACVLVAAEEKGMALRAIPLKRTVAREFARAGGATNNAWNFEDDSLQQRGRKRVTDLRGTICCFLGGRYPIALMLRKHPRPFDFVLPDEPELPIEADAEIIPAGIMRRVVERGARRSLQTLAKIVEATRGSVYQFEPPPPVGESSGLKMGLERAYLRLKVWRLHSAIVREHADRLGAGFVPHPPQAVDDAGFLRGEYCLTSTHANAAYGSLVLDQIAALQ